MFKDVRNDASHENARLIVENARLREKIKDQQELIFAIEEMAINDGYKSILKIISDERNKTKGDKNLWHSH